MRELTNEHWVVETKDNKVDSFYPVGGVWKTHDLALFFATQCLRGNRKRYSRIVKIEVYRTVT